MINPKISYGECVAILAQFEDDFPAIAQSPNTLGIRVGILGNELAVKVAVRKKLPSNLVGSGEEVPASYSIFGRTLQCKVLESTPGRFSYTGCPASAQVFRAADGSMISGLVGWNYATFDGRMWFISNWHVLTLGDNNYAEINQTLLKIRTAQYQPDTEAPTVAVLSHFEPVSDGADNHFDFAIAEYLPEAYDLVKGLFSASCGEYPMKLSTDIDHDAKYFSVGVAGDLCRQGRLIDVGSTQIETDPDDHTIPVELRGKLYTFKDQLFFEKLGGGAMTEYGDSGSVIVQEGSKRKTGPLGRSTNPSSVTGLIFSIFEGYTVANPIFRLGWKTTGTLALGRGRGTLPVFGKPRDPFRLPFLYPKWRLPDPPPEDLIGIGERVFVRGPAGELDAVVLEKKDGWVRLLDTSAPAKGVREVWVHAESAAWSQL